MEKGEEGYQKTANNNDEIKEVKLRTVHFFFLVFFFQQFEGWREERKALFLSVWDEGVELAWLETIHVRIHFQYPPLLFHSPPSSISFCLSLYLPVTQPDRFVGSTSRRCMLQYLLLISQTHAHSHQLLAMLCQTQAMLPCSNPFFSAPLVQYVGARNTPFFGRQNSLGGTIAVERTGRESRGPIDRGMRRKRGVWTGAEWGHHPRVVRDEGWKGTLSERWDLTRCLL